MLVSLVLSAALAADRPVGPGRTYSTVQDAVQGAGSGDVIVIDAGTYPTPALQFAGRTLTFRGAGNGLVVLEATGGESLIRVNGGGVVLEDLVADGLGVRRIVDANNSDVTLTNVTLRNGATAGDGGLVSARGDVVVTDSILSDGRAGGAGGLLDVDGMLTLARSTFTLGDAPIGAAVRVTGDLDGTDVTFTEQTGADGTVWCGSSCDLANARFESNQVTRGAAVQLTGAGASALDGLVVCGNEGSALIDVQSGSVALERALVFSNTVVASTVRIDAGGVASITNTHLVGNIASGAAAAVDVMGSLELRNTLIASNSGTGPVVVASGTLNATYNLYFDNIASDSSVAAHPSELFVDPLLVGLVAGSCDPAGIEPQPGSPVTDAGDPALLDDDGSRSDIGAFVPGLVPFVDVDGDGVAAADDCDDSDPDVFPGATELQCSGVDEDCDPSTPDDLDADGDGVSVCADDCDDADAARAPGLPDIACSGVDEDCDPSTPDEPDDDGDGVSVCDDCDDADPAVNPAALEVLCNGVDEDCSGLTLDAPDADGDGTSVCDGDCVDTDAGVGPGVEEVPYDGIDQDCSGADLDDVDGDGHSLQDDCDDDDAAIHPGAIDVPEDTIDQDCTGFDVTTDLTGRLGYRCGCATSSSATPAWLVVLALFGWRRRQSVV